MTQAVQQQRAKFALDQVKERMVAYHREKESDKWQKEFVSYANALPAMIQMNGLGQAMAFCRYKGGRHEDLYQLLSEWLRGTGQPYHSYHDLLDGITASDMHHYRLAQVESQALLNWVKKFAKAFMAHDEVQA